MDRRFIANRAGDAVLHERQLSGPVREHLSHFVSAERWTSPGWLALWDRFDLLLARILRHLTSGWDQVRSWGIGEKSAEHLRLVEDSKGRQLLGDQRAWFRQRERTAHFWPRFVSIYADESEWQQSIGTGIGTVLATVLSISSAPRLIVQSNVASC